MNDTNHESSDSASRLSPSLPSASQIQQTRYDSGIQPHTVLASIVSNRRRVSALKKMGVETVGDLLQNFPFRVTDRVPVRTLDQCHLGEKNVVVAIVRRVTANSMRAKQGHRVEVLVEDTTGRVAHLIYFTYKKYYVTYLNQRFTVGQTIVLCGVASEFGGNLQFTHPVTCTVKNAYGHGEVQTVEEAVDKLSRPHPVYHATSAISSEHIHEIVVQCLRAMAGIVDADTLNNSDDAKLAPENALNAPALENSGDDVRALFHENSYEHLRNILPDVIPEEIREERELLHKADAYVAIHMPYSKEDFEKGRDTIRFEEALVSQMTMVSARRNLHNEQAYVCDDDQSYVQRVVDSLPFIMTDGQRQVVEDIREDMLMETPMSRLLQGEVGSGKTIVAFTALLRAVSAGYQAVLVAPTQVLARQHVESLMTMLTHAGLADKIPVVLIVSGLKLAERRKALAVPASGVPCIVVATHAAFSSTFQAPRVAVVIIDEQHRFGVAQREILRSQTNDDSKIPHMLVMTATPIPRTAAMTWFGNLDMSELTELPSGRKKVKTIVVNDNDFATMRAMFAHVRSRINNGERAYVVCARIDDSDDSHAQSIEHFDYDPDTGEPIEQSVPHRPAYSVQGIAQRFSQLDQFNGTDIVTLTGRDDDMTKVEIMEKFASGQSPLMVATTVIEVGVDVPQASCIIVFNAERFGLAQLHQLRGRVGRGGTDAWAFLVYSSSPAAADGQLADDSESLARERLNVLAQSHDGAYIAMRDMQIRGVGDVLGDMQSGMRSSFKLLDVVNDSALIEAARDYAQKIDAHDPKLSSYVELAGAVVDFINQTQMYLSST